MGYHNCPCLIGILFSRMSLIILMKSLLCFINDIDWLVEEHEQTLLEARHDYLTLKIEPLAAQIIKQSNKTSNS